ncbi:MAG: hypothetical protein ABIX28_14685 [Vicinamibacterales bacterium]
MSEPRIGRILIASLHQSIQDLLPNRIEFYENWLSTAGLREGTIGLAPLSAVLSFLRLEGETYDAVTTRAGAYAGDWTMAALPPMERRLTRLLPARWRAKSALRVARGLITASYPGTRTVVTSRQGTTTIDLRGSLFCEVREASTLPLCGFYVAAIDRVFSAFGLAAEVQVNACRARGTDRGCRLAVRIVPPAAAEPASA